MSTAEEIKDSGNHYCFACGENNPIGLHLQFQFIGEKFVATTTLSRNFQSYAGVVHGGIVSTMLDEAMGSLLVERGEKAVTAKMELRYRKPTPVGESLTITGWVESRRRNAVITKGTITLADGTVTAEASATMMIIG